MNNENKKDLDIKRNIIGEGAYGCVIKPSLHCANKQNLNYNDYVSKFMKTKHADIELKEFLFIGKIDPKNDYHLGEPILCEPDFEDPQLINDIKQCTHINKDDFLSDSLKKDYSLLLIKYGGPDLKALCNKQLSQYLSNNKIKKTDKFWLEVHHLIKGIKFFRDNGIVHNDIKPQNILFNMKTGKMKYIDFGLMRTKNDIINLSKKSKNNLGVFHWSYPFDCGYMNKSKFKYYKKLIKSPLYKKDYQEQFGKIIVLNSKTNSYEIDIKKPEAFKILFAYLNLHNHVPESTTQFDYISSFFDGFNHLVINESYDDVLNNTADSIDVFGLGFTLQFMANCFKNHNAISLSDYTRLSTFFHKMYDFNPLTRIIDFNLLLNEYENILLEMGVLTRLNKSFKNNLLKDSSSHFSSKYPLSRTLDEFANKDAVLIHNEGKRCPYDKELNPLTNRCVKKCNNGYERNVISRRCRKSKMAKNHSITKRNKKNSRSRYNTI